VWVGSPWLGVAATSPCDSGAVVGPPVTELDNRQLWRARKGWRHSGDANTRGNGSRRGGDLARAALVA
jgi:hypothetical protein